MKAFTKKPYKQLISCLLFSSKIFVGRKELGLFIQAFILCLAPDGQMCVRSALTAFPVQSKKNQNKFFSYTATKPQSLLIHWWKHE